MGLVGGHLRSAAVLQCVGDRQYTMNYSTTRKSLILDLGTQTGWALLANGIVTSGTVGFQTYKGCKSRPADHAGQVFINFQRWLRGRIQDDKPTEIAYEDVYRWSSGDAAKLYCGLRAFLLANGALYGLPVTGYSPSMVKKYWTGKGNSDKDAMMAETKRRFPALRLSDSNEADALAILHLHLSKT